MEAFGFLMGETYITNAIWSPFIINILNNIKFIVRVSCCIDSRLSREGRGKSTPQVRSCRVEGHLSGEKIGHCKHVTYIRHCYIRVSSS